MSGRADCPDLLDYVEGALEPARARMVEEHVQKCTDCDRWLRTYRELAQVSSCTIQAPSTLLAEYAVAPERIDEADRVALVAHLEGCDRCRDELDLVRTALDQARQEPSRAPLRPTLAPFWLSPARAAIAAALVLLSAAGAWLVRSPVDRTVPTELSAPLEEGLQETVQGRVAMVIENTRIQPGGALSIRAPGSVAFGNGFSVGAGARLRVEIVRTKPAADLGSAGPKSQTTERNMP